MGFPKIVFKLIATLAFAAVSAGTSATPLVIDFDDLSPDWAYTTSNLVTRGVSFSPNCHLHTWSYQAQDPFSDVEVPSPTGQWLGFDPSGCLSDVHNDDYLGPTNIGLPGKLFISLANHKTFTLDKFDFIRRDGGANYIQVESSRGGAITYTPQNVGGGEVLFAGDAWRDVDWVLLSVQESGSFSGIDNLTLDDVHHVPEPGSSAAWISLAAALFVLRKRMGLKA